MDNDNNNNNNDVSMEDGDNNSNNNNDTDVSMEDGDNPDADASGSSSAAPQHRDMVYKLSLGQSFNNIPSKYSKPNI